MHPTNFTCPEAAIVPADRRPGVVWAGLVYSSAGFGHEARSLIGALNRDGLHSK